MTRSRIAALCAALACTTRVADPPPRPLAVTPSSGYQGAENPIVILGEDFQAQPYQDANGRPRVDGAFRAWMAGVELGGVTWVSTRELRARVPPGLLPLGVQRLEVQSPAGAAGALDGAFTVLAGNGAILQATATITPGVVSPGDDVVLAVSVTNSGDAAANGVAVTVSVTGNALVLLPPEPAAQDIAPGATATFFQAGHAARVGTAILEVDAAGIEAVTGRVVTSPHLTLGALVVQQEEVAKVLDDPFLDGTPFSFVFGYDGHVFLGPSGDGRGVVRCLPDGTGCASFTFAFSRDVTGSTIAPLLLTSLSQNACPSLTTLGSALGSPPACDPVSPQNTACSCGPDYESGRGLMGSFTLGTPGDEWLVAMGRTEKAGWLNYLYMTRDVASPLRFSYVDLYTAMPFEAGATSVASMAVLNDRLYVGLQVVDAARPRIAVLTRTPAPPGLDCSSSDAFATALQGTPMGESGTTGVSQVDAMLAFEGRLFVANRRAVLVSRTGSPTGDPDASTQFDDCTPPAAGGWEATSITKYTGKIDLGPADRGVAGLAAWRGRLYLARNTRPPPPGTAPAVPELWVFTPRHDPTSGAFLGCLPGDWQIIATDFAVPGNTTVTALFASASHLYVGYDNPDGLGLFRTAAPSPSSEADFTGRLSCTAPCTPLGGVGFGDATNTRFLDARAITFGGVDQVWATVGSGTGPVRVYRVSE